MSVTTSTKERGIIFSAESVVAILKGTKTQTRRVIKPQPPSTKRGRPWASVEDLLRRCRYGVAGDRLWVRERWVDCGGYFRYPATDDIHELRKVKSPLRMPRSASRIDLEIVEVRAERLHEITEGDAKAEGVRVPAITEGCPPGKCMELFNADSPYRPWEHGHEARAEYALQWDALNKARGFGWEKNPWVWVISFKRV